MTPSRSSTISLLRAGRRTTAVGGELNHGGARIWCQLGDVGDAVHRGGHAAQKRQPVGADRRVVGHHHHVVEVAVDGGLGGGEREQRAGEVARLVVGRRPAARASGTREEVVLGAVGEAPAIDGSRGLAADFFQDVDDALVGGGQRGGFGQRRERLHGR